MSEASIRLHKMVGIMAQDKKENVKEQLCNDCESWKVFGEKCWFYWHRKKECSNHSHGFKSVKESLDQVEHYIAIRDNTSRIINHNRVPGRQ